MRSLFILLMCLVLGGCVSNPAATDVGGPQSASFYGSKAAGILKDARSAQVALVRMNDEREVIQLDVTRPRHLPPGRHRVKVGITVIDRTSFVTFPFVAEAGKSYHFTGREVKDGFEVTAFEGPPQEGRVVFRAHVPFGPDATFTYLEKPVWSE